MKEIDLDKWTVDDMVSELIRLSVKGLKCTGDENELRMMIYGYLISSVEEYRKCN